MKYATRLPRSRTACHSLIYCPGEGVDSHSVDRGVRRPERPDIRACLKGSRGGSSNVCDSGASRASELRLHTATHLRIAVPALLAHTLIAPALPRFLEQHPAMRVQLLISEQPGESVQYDAAIGIRSFDQACQRSTHCIAVMPSVLCASEEFLAARGTPRGPQELNPAHCIGVLDDDANPSAWSFQQGSTEVTIAPAAPLMFGDVQCAVASAVRGGGFILAPELAVESQIAAGLLRPLLPDWIAPRCAVWMKYPGARTAELQPFANFVAGLLPFEASAS